MAQILVTGGIVCPWPDRRRSSTLRRVHLPSARRIEELIYDNGSDDLTDTYLHDHDFVHWLSRPNTLAVARILEAVKRLEFLLDHPRARESPDDIKAAGLVIRATGA
jgi:hypothetical protein